MALSCSKNVSALLRGMTSKGDGDFYCLNCIYSFRTKDKLGSYKKACKNKDFCDFVMPTKEAKILELNQDLKSVKMPYIIDADLVSLIKK